MAEEEDSFLVLMERLKGGDEDAAYRVFDKYANRLIALARNRLSGPLRKKMDPEDVLQSALNSFFKRQAQGQFQLNGWDNLWQILVVLTLRKCGHKVEYFQAGKRDIHREVAALGEDSSLAGWQAMAREPTPLEAAALNETLEQLMAALEKREQTILNLSLEGYSVRDISSRIGYTERTVQRVLKKIQGLLERQRDERKEGA